MSWTYCYPVEELFKLLNEELHSAGLHGSAKCTIEELQHEEIKSDTKENTSCQKTHIQKILEPTLYIL